jgi:hypothetical protein
MKKILLLLMCVSLCGCTHAIGAGIAVSGMSSIITAAASSKDVINILKGLKDVSMAVSQICYTSLPALQEVSMSVKPTTTLGTLNSYALNYCLDLTSNGTPVTTDQNSVNWLTTILAQENMLKNQKTP